MDFFRIFMSSLIFFFLQTCLFWYGIYLFIFEFSNLRQLRTCMVGQLFLLIRLEEFGYIYFVVHFSTKYYY